MRSQSNQEQHSDLIERLLGITQQLVTEVHPGFSQEIRIKLDSSLEKDLGLDSLARVQLISRIENEFNLALPERTFAEAESPRDLARVIVKTKSPKADLSAQIHSIAIDETRDSPDEAFTLIDVILWHVKQHPDRPHIHIYQDEGNGPCINYQQLLDNATYVATGLQQRGLSSGEPVAIMLPSGEEYFYSFLGILLAGGIPVPIYPPARPSQLEDHMRRHVHILNNCIAHILITVKEAKAVANLLRSQVPSLKHITTVKELQDKTSILSSPPITEDDIAFIQYTSGSTGNPKGVVLTHRNLLANIRAMGEAVQANSKDVFVSWLPLYHDMGLIGAWLGSLYFAAQFVVMSPLKFLSRPERWLWAIHRYGGTLAASPNFGYEFCTRRIKDKDIEGLDLSSWRCAFNGAEAVIPESIESFSSRFSAYQFNTSSMMPVYGLAESSVGLAFPPLKRGPLIDRVDRMQFMQNGEARAAQEDDAHALSFPSCGLPLKKHDIRIVDQANHELPERHEGRLQFRGPSATGGYYRNPEKTKELFIDDWLDSGDLAYLANGEVYLTGRIKDIIIKAGRNIYPHELEEAVGNVEGIRNGRVAVFGSKDGDHGTERLIVLAETRATDQAEKERLRAQVNALSVDLIGSAPDEVVLAPPNTVLKTSSGKIRRAASREVYEKGKVGKASKAVWWQVLHLTLSSIIPQIRRSLRYLGSWFFALYAWASYGLLAPIVWLSALLLPVFRWRWGIMRGCSRLLAKMTGVKINVRGLENVEKSKGPFIIVCNHSSLIDSYVLVASLPDTYRFIAKEELAKSFITRKPLENIHTEFVERFDIKESAKETERLAKHIHGGDSLIIFAEGTFDRVPGLRPFHLGAFSIAAETGAPIIPVAIRGTRSILRADTWFPHRGSVDIEIGDPIYPNKTEENTWNRAIDLRDRCRAYILEHCGEPDMSQNRFTIE
jgi:1-acyl-sn-glycerol-3-phosphate acyltransferase